MTARAQRPGAGRRLAALAAMAALAAGAALAAVNGRGRSPPARPAGDKSLPDHEDRPAGVRMRPRR